MNGKIIERGTWVQIHAIILEAAERTGKLPEDTKNVPLEMWVKGFLRNDAAVNDTVEIETITGRRVEGKLIDVNPVYRYGFGNSYIPELLQIGIQARKIMRGEI